MEAIRHTSNFRARSPEQKWEAEAPCWEGGGIIEGVELITHVVAQNDHPPTLAPLTQISNRKWEAHETVQHHQVGHEEKEKRSFKVG